MPTDFSFVLEDRPGALAVVAETLGRAGINLLGGCGIPCGGQGVIHFLVDDAAAARKALQGANIAIAAEQPVLLVTVDDWPGAFAKVVHKLADVGVNINLLYITIRGQGVLGVDDIDKARAVL